MMKRHICSGNFYRQNIPWILQQPLSVMLSHGVFPEVRSDDMEVFWLFNPHLQKYAGYIKIIPQLSMPENLYFFFSIF
jgi:hypothetical protein